MVTIHSLASVTWLLSAQRLSASKEWSRGRHQVFRQHLFVCSTPFGIKGMVTSSGGCRSACNAGVLNAFRHQRNGHSVRGRPLTLAEWVLNAFRHQRNGHRLAPPIKSDSFRVLNAFRHQRNGHAGVGSEGDDVVGVLNAFRHQRNGHIIVVLSACWPLWCSTPFGIKGMVTTRRSVRSARSSGAQRLSASKEWSQGHPCRSIGAIGCSTPFGIKGMVTIACSGVSCSEWSAQRLSASKEWSLLLFGYEQQIVKVLNAFRHQRNGHIRRR